MKTLTRAGSLVAIAAMAVASQANLFSNGGFEAYSTSAADGGGIGPGYFTYNAGNAGLNDWTIGGTSVDIVTVPPGIYPIFAGNASLDLLGTPGPGSISQSIATVVGQSYDISFWAQANAAGINQTVNLEAIGAATQSTSFTVAVGTWTQYTWSFVADSASTNIRFSSDPLNAGNGNTFIDNVEAVPEPMSMTALALGLAALARRRARKA